MEKSKTNISAVKILRWALFCSKTHPASKQN